MTTVLLSGLTIGESARWHDGRLWLADWGTGRIIAVDPDGGSETVVQLAPDTIPISFDWLPDGRMVIVSGSDALLLRREADGSLVPHADLSAQAAICNELVADRAGRVYVNGGAPDFATGTGPGVIVAVDPDGSIRQVAEDIAFGNGMALTPDGSTLIVAESWARRLSAFNIDGDIDGDGALSGRRVWAECSGPPDGICIDAEGAVWYADVPNQQCVRIREGGQVLQTVPLDRGCFSCMLGGPDGRTLFVLAAQWHGIDQVGEGQPTGQLCAVDAPAAHAGRP